MSDKSKGKNNLIMMTECAVMLALAIVLSLLRIFKMPMGGSITLFSMLPICLVAVKYGAKQGLSTAFLFMVFKIVKALIEGDVFVYTVGAFAVIVCVLFDYVLPFTCLGFAGIFRKHGNAGILCGISLVVIFRFICHYVTGVVIWGQWAPEGMGKYMYSLLYNGQYMLPELIITVVLAAVLINIPQMRRLLNLPPKEKKTA